MEDFQVSGASDRVEGLSDDWQNAEPERARASHPELAEVEAEFTFDSFRVIPAQRLLLGPDRPIRVGARAFDLLVVLLERAGHLVSKSELFARVWPQACVEDGNLKVHVSALRRALGDGQAGKRLISSVNGRGYSFVAPVRRYPAPPLPAAPIAPPAGAKVPRPLTRLVGLEDAVGRIADLTAAHRLISIVGAGGVGKSSVALGAAAALEDAFADGVCLIDLSAVEGAANLAPSLEAALRRHLADTTSNDLLSLIGGRSILLVLDNREHLADALSPWITQLLRFAPGVKVISTSREPLGVAGERLHHVPPLGLPRCRDAIEAHEVLRYPAIQLFVERASDALGEFELLDHDAAAVVSICRKLDGLPLAIELAAAHLKVLGLRGLDRALDEPLRLSKASIRSASPRHQSLHTMLDWSYRLLTPQEQRLLLALSTLEGSFSLEEAVAIAADDPGSDADPMALVFSLVAKSLVLPQSGCAGGSLRILRTTRAFAAAKQRERREAAGQDRHEGVVQPPQAFSDCIRRSPAWPESMAQAPQTTSPTLSGSSDAAAGARRQRRARPRIRPSGRFADRTAAPN